MFKFSLTFVPILTAPYSPLPPVRGGLFSLSLRLWFFLKKKSRDQVIHLFYSSWQTRHTVSTHLNDSWMECIKFSFSVIDPSCKFAADVSSKGYNKDLRDDNFDLILSTWHTWLIVSRWTKYNTLFSFWLHWEQSNSSSDFLQERWTAPPRTAVICYPALLMTVLSLLLYWCHFAAHRASSFLCTGSTPRIECSCKGLILKGRERKGGDGPRWEGDWEVNGRANLKEGCQGRRQASWS